MRRTLGQAGRPGRRRTFVVHTRRGRTEPLHVGLGVSFRYDPATDSFRVPGATTSSRSSRS